jgi:hypothetical protein
MIQRCNAVTGKHGAEYVLIRRKEKMTYVGFSNNTDSQKAGREAARAAKNQFRNEETVSWVLGFCGGRHEPDSILAGIWSELGDIPIYGGASVGIVTNDSIGYTGYECGLTVFTLPFPAPDVVVNNNLEADEFNAGKEIGKALDELTNEGDTVLMFYTNLRSTPPPVLYTGSSLMDGLYAGLNKTTLNIIGSGLIGDFLFSPSFVFDGHKTVKHSIIGIVFPDNLIPHTRIMHGCKPVSSFKEITRIDGPVLYELDGYPATEVFSKMLGIDSKELCNAKIPFVVTLGKKYGEQFTPFDEQMYVNRLVIGSNYEKGSVTIFEADFKQGDMVQLMSRDNHLMVESVDKGTAELMETIDLGNAGFALYIDCAGRASGFSGSEIEEANVVRKTIGNGMPFLGFYSGVEIAPLLLRSRPLDWTGVLTVFTNR